MSARTDGDGREGAAGFFADMEAKANAAADPHGLDPAILADINKAEIHALRHWLDCDKNSGPELFPTVEAFNAWMRESSRNGDYRIEAAVERRIAHLEREEAAAALCFQRAEEYRAQAKPLNGEDCED